jgi:hypothetical protein
MDDHDVGPVPVNQPPDDVRGELVVGPEAIARDQDTHV